jgi:hypothetical protein
MVPGVLTTTRNTYDVPWYVHVYKYNIISKVHVYVPWYVPCVVLFSVYHGSTCVQYVRGTYVPMVLIMLCHNFLIGKGHMCTENHVCFGRIHGSQLREGANAGQHTPTLYYNVCEHVGLDTNQSLHHPLSATSWPLKYPWVRESAAGRDPWDPRRVSRKRWARLLM